VRAAAALLAAATLAAQQAPEVNLHTFEVEVRPPDMVFRFAPDVRVPGEPQIHLALSGGGARGVAHIGILQRLDEDGLPVRSVTGTSIGALMASLYALGYSPAEIQELFTQVDFERAFLDSLRRIPGETFSEQARENESLVTLERERQGWAFTKGIPGKQMQRVLEGLFARGTFFSQGDFDRLRVPLRVVASNLQTGEAKVFSSGDLVEAVRASTAVPGAFRPVEIGGQQFVDGALVENLPVHIAREQFPGGFVFGVDISAPLAQRQASNLFSVAARSLDLTIERAQWESRRAADFLLRPDLPETSFTSYHSQITALVRAGRSAYDEAQPKLLEALRKAFGGSDPLEADAVEMPTLGWPGDEILQANLGHRPLVSSDVYVALQQLMVRGLAASAKARLVLRGGRRILVVEVTPQPLLKELDVIAPAEVQGRLQTLLGEGLGRPFNPRILGHALSHAVHELVRRGRALVDARETAFDPATGVLRVVLKEPTVRSVSVEAPEGMRLNTAYLTRVVKKLEGQPLATPDLQRTLGLAENRLHLKELRHYALPGADEPGKVDLLVAPAPQTTQALDFSLGWETRLGGQGSLAYRAFGLGGLGSELELEAGRNRFQEGASFTLRGPFQVALATGLELQGATFRQRMEPTFSAAPFAGPDGAWAGNLRSDEAALRTYLRFGNAGTGKASLEGGFRKTYEEDPLGAASHRELNGFLAAEWDDFDRHTLPTQGLLLRLRAGGGRVRQEDGFVQGYRLAYLAARGRLALAPAASLELEGEGGWSRNLPLDRWWRLGGTEFLLGSRALAYQVPGFGALRLSLPLQMQGPLGSIVEFGPRMDAAQLDGAWADHGRLAPVPLRGCGLFLRTTVFKFLVEASFGAERWTPPGQEARRATTFNVRIGPQPFGLWRHP
jgi:predicted acylesterase/phospholipase RssA